MRSWEGADQEYEDLVNGDWVGSADNLWELLTGLILDTRTPLERMAVVTRNLKAAKYGESNLLDFRVLHEIAQTTGAEHVANLLKIAGYPWYNQKSRFFEAVPEFDLGTVIGNLSITVSNLVGSSALNPVIIAVGTATNTTGHAPAVARAIKTTLYRSSIFPVGLMSKVSLDMNGNNIYVDSYDSSDPTKSTTNGLYSAARLDLPVVRAPSRVAGTVSRAESGPPD